MGHALLVAYLGGFASNRWQFSLSRVLGVTSKALFL